MTRPAANADSFRVGVPADADRRGVRLHTRVIPATRMAGLLAAATLIPIQNYALTGDPGWASAWLFVTVSAVYGLGSWWILRQFFARSKLHLGTFFLAADISLLILAIDLSGGPNSWLFLLLAARCTDQIFFGLRRVIWFNHAVVAAYAVYLAQSALEHEMAWPREITKLVLLYAFNWYYALSAQSMETMRRRGRRAKISKRNHMEMTALVAHAIRTRINALLLVLGGLRKTPLNGEQLEYASIMTECSQSLLRIGEVLNVGDEDAALPAEIVPFAPVLLVEQTAAIVRPLAQAKGIDIRVDADEGAFDLVAGDSAAIQQTLLSLTHNAVQFTSLGHVSLKTWRPSTTHVAFEIRDSGSGIPAFVQHDILSPLYRADGSRWHRTRGRNVSLSMSKRLVESMGGEFVIDSSYDRGTVVRFTLEVRSTANGTFQGADFCGSMPGPKMPALLRAPRL